MCRVKDSRRRYVDHFRIGPLHLKDRLTKLLLKIIGNAVLSSGTCSLASGGPSYGYGMSEPRIDAPSKIFGPPSILQLDLVALGLPTFRHLKFVSQEGRTVAKKAADEDKDDLLP